MGVPDFGKPVIAGLILLGIVCAIMGAGVVLLIWWALS